MHQYFGTHLNFNTLIKFLAQGSHFEEVLAWRQNVFFFFFYLFHNVLSGWVPALYEFFNVNGNVKKNGNLGHVLPLQWVKCHYFLTVFIMQIQVCIWLWPKDFLKLLKISVCASHRNVLVMVSSFFFLTQLCLPLPTPVHKENFPSFIWFLILNLFWLKNNKN